MQHAIGVRPIAIATPNVVVAVATVVLPPTGLFGGDLNGFQHTFRLRQGQLPFLRQGVLIQIQQCAAIADTADKGTHCSGVQTILDRDGMNPC